MVVKLEIKERSRRFGYIYWTKKEKKTMKEFFKNLKCCYELNVTTRKKTTDSFNILENFFNTKFSKKELLNILEEHNFNKKEIDEIFNNFVRENVEVWFENSFLGNKCIDWKYNRISIGWKNTRRVEKTANYYVLNKKIDGSLEVKCI